MFEQVLPYIDSPLRFAAAMLAVVLIWIAFERATR
jgi:hypothetical protein